jgi:hypothetical protein
VRIYVDNELDQWRQDLACEHQRSGATDIAALEGWLVSMDYRLTCSSPKRRSPSASVPPKA